MHKNSFRLITGFETFFNILSICVIFGKKITLQKYEFHIKFKAGFDQSKRPYMNRSKIVEFELNFFTINTNPQHL